MLGPVVLSLLALGMPQGKGHDHGTPPGLAKKGGMPPGQAKRYGVPPGLAQTYGPRIPQQPCIAVDPRYHDRAYFLVDGHWEVRKGFDVTLQAEVRDLLRMPAVPPPVPLPRVGVDLHVVLFN